MLERRIIEGGYLEEIWRDVKGYEGLYQISNLGRVKSLNYKKMKVEKILSLKPKKQGYARVNFSKNGIRKTFTVHRLVALAFIPKEKNKNLINHKNEIKNDNRVCNLEWCDSQYNLIYSLKNKRTFAKKSSPKGVIALEDKAKQARNEYMKKWRERNKDKVKAAQERYWENKSKVMSN